MPELKDLHTAYYNKAPREALDALLRRLTEAVDDYDGTTALHMAAGNGDAEGIRLLLSLGVDTNAVDKYDNTALHRLKQFGKWEEEPKRMYDCAVALLEGGCNPNRRDESGQCFYHETAQLGMLPLFEALRDSGKRANATLSSGGENALHLACRGMSMYGYLRGKPGFDEAEERYLGIVRCLLDCGVDAQAETGIGKKALDFAVENHAKRIAAFLRDGSLDETAVAAGGMTLHQAVWQEDLSAITALVSLGADLNEIAETGDHKGLTPLMTAAMGLRPQAVKALLDTGANPLFRDGTTGHTALWALCTTLNMEVRIPGGRPDEKRFFDTMNALLVDKKAAAQPLDEEGRTALHVVCLNARKSWWVGDRHAQSLLLPALLKAGADPNAADSAGRTALHLLCACGEELAQTLAMTLLERGADIGRKDGRGRLPIHYAAELGDKPAALAMVETMLDFGEMDFDAPDNDGKTPMDLAVERDNAALLNLMMK